MKVGIFLKERKGCIERKCIYKLKNITLSKIPIADKKGFQKIGLYCNSFRVKFN
jgi:hypothetical protein